MLLWSRTISKLILIVRGLFLFNLYHQYKLRQKNLLIGQQGHSSVSSHNVKLSPLKLKGRMCFSSKSCWIEILQVNEVITLGVADRLNYGNHHRDRAEEVMKV